MFSAYKHNDLNIVLISYWIYLGVLTVSVKVFSYLHIKNAISKYVTSLAGTWEDIWRTHFDKEIQIQWDSTLYLLEW